MEKAPAAAQSPSRKPVNEVQRDRMLSMVLGKVEVEAGLHVDRWLTDDNMRHGLGPRQIVALQKQLLDTLAHRNTARILLYTPGAPQTTFDVLFPIVVENVKYAIREMRNRCIGSVAGDSQITFSAVMFASSWYNSLLPRYFLPRDSKYVQLAAPQLKAALGALHVTNL